MGGFRLESRPLTELEVIFHTFSEANPTLKPGETGSEQYLDASDNSLNAFVVPETPS